MTCESEAAGVWAALLGMSFFIAATVTTGYWLCVYHEEARQLEPYVAEPCTTIQMIWDDIRMPGL
jgi:hypothetical protein